MMNKRITTSTFALLVMSSLAMAEEEHMHFDISPLNQGGQIVTQGVTHAIDGKKYFSPSMRVFEYEFGHSDGGGSVPANFSDSPGVNREAATYRTLDDPAQEVALGLTGLSGTLHFTFVDGLKQWAGDGFELADSGEDVLFFLNGYMLTIDAAPGERPPLDAGLAADGSIHKHASVYINNADAGIYLLSARLESDDPGVTSSEPFYLVYNYGAAEADHEAAVAYVETHYVPEPVLGGIVGTMALLMLRRKRK